MTRLASSGLAAVALAAAFLLPLPLAAQSEEQLIQEGLALRRQRRDDEALGRFQRAYEIARSARAMAQMGLAEQALGRLEDAEIHLAAALDVSADAWVAQRRAELTSSLEAVRAQLGTLELRGGAPGAEVYVNGELRGTLPHLAQLRVRAGSVALEVRAAGYVTLQRPIEVAGGAVVREIVSLVPAGAPAPPVQAPPPVLPPPPATHASGMQPIYPRREVSTHPNWTLFGAGTGIFAGAWVLTWSITLGVAGGDSDAIGFSFIPVVGPFVLLGESTDEGSGLILLLDGLAQGAGLVLAIIGLASRQREYALGDRPDAPRLTVLPTALPGRGAGLALSITHF